MTKSGHWACAQMSAILVLLYACTPQPSKQDLVDPDGDGSLYGVDCDDTRGDVYPGAEEVCDDDVVNDCDGAISEVWAYCGRGESLSLSGADLKLTGEGANDWAGWTVSGAGDVNGDGFNDILVGAFGKGSSETETGAAYLLFGERDLGGTSRVQSLFEANLKLTSTDPEEHVGHALCGVGDMDGDGLDDLLLDAGNNALYLGLGGGALYGASGTLSLSASDLKITDVGAEDGGAYSPSGAGDVNGDGLIDLLIGDSREDRGGPSAGAAYLLLSGYTLDPTSGTQDLSNADSFYIGEAMGDGAGAVVSFLGDMNGDGFDDMVIGADNEDSGGSNAGATYLLLGIEGYGAASGLMGLSGSDLKIIGEAPSDHSGIAVSGAGDVNGDGYGELIVGAYGEGSGGAEAGAAYLLLGKSTLGGVSDSFSLSDADLKIIGRAEGDWAGISVSDAGDINGDSLDDLLISDLSDSTYGSNVGATNLLLGGGALDSSVGVISVSNADCRLTGEIAGDQAGWPTSGAGDVNGDGFDDLLIGAWHENSGGSYAGAAYLVLGGEF